MRVLPNGVSLVSRSAAAAFRPSPTSAWPAVAGLAMLITALVLIGPAVHLRNTPEVYGMVALAIAGLGIFMLSLTARVAERQRELERTNAGLERGLNELKESNRGLDSAKRRAEGILAGLPGRVLVLDADGRIQGDFASQLEPSVPPVEGAAETFADLLRPVVSAQTLATARDYLKALFDPERDGRALAAANPLQSVEAGVRDEEGVLHERTLSFRFRRLRENGSIARVTVALEDVSARIEAERNAHEGERRKAKHFDTLLGILYVDRVALDAFVNLAKDELGAIDHVLRGADVTAAGGSDMTNLRLRLETLTARAGTIKDHATLLGFEHFEKRAAAYQALLEEVQSRPRLSGHDFLELIKAQSEFRGELEDLQALRFKLGTLRRAAKLTSEADDELIGWLATRAHKLADELGREFEFEADGFDSRALPPEQRGVVKDALTELMRNALLHGVEPPIEREIAGKARAAVLEIRPLHDLGPDTFGFTFRDDGRGLDPARIRDRAIKLGMLDEQQASRLDDSDAAGMIFAPGFTTAQDAHGTPARGQGLSALKARVVDACGGTISLDAEYDAFTEFTIVLPIAAKRPGLFRR
jgi:two-component system, chemotaxis family, sensor kinase CheA